MSILNPIIKPNNAKKPQKLNISSVARLLLGNYMILMYEIYFNILITISSNNMPSFILLNLLVLGCKEEMYKNKPF